MRRKWLSGLGALVLTGMPLLAMAQSWDKNMASGPRFQTLPSFQNQAVLDKNTGLVWEQTPSTEAYPWSHPVFQNTARYQCASKTVGGILGWRLPSVIELMSVQDPSLPIPFVPTGVFNVQIGSYWSASVNNETPGTAWAVGISPLSTPGRPSIVTTSTALNVWCVRGPMQESAY